MPRTGKRETRSQQSWRAAVTRPDFNTPAQYNKALEALISAEKSRAFDAEVTATASDVERRAAGFVEKLRAHDWEIIYGQPYDAQGLPTGKRTEGEHFLGNVDFISRTKLLQVAKKMPKGAHLHIHFNSCLPAKFLIQQARHIQAMYIRSTLPLTTPENWAASRISFMVMTPHEATHIKNAEGTFTEIPLGNIWDASYVPNTWMSYGDFQEQFDFVDETGHHLKKSDGAETWLERKMIISEDEAYGARQTGRGQVDTHLLDLSDS
ncbi:Adenosine deaminase [Chlorociboria aeruginascens]|nr:Adenosine deaminase [Chlorociboria aeruginascens]